MEITPELIVGIVGIVGAGLNYWYTKNKTSAEARDIEATAAGRMADSAVKLVNELQEQLTTQAERIDRLEKLTREQEKTIAGHQVTIQEQGAVIMQLRQRVGDLEHENGRLKIENDQLKQRSNRL